jgi:uncharacterized protein (DUF2236 family)
MFGRYRRARHVQTLDPERDYAEICRIVTRYEFPWDYRVGFQFSVMTDLLIPSISQVLSKSRNFADEGQKRFDDTMLAEYEVKRHGPDSTHGRDTVRVVNNIHRHYAIANDDFLYVLVSQTLSPIDWINSYAWRRLTDHEVRALVHSARRQGELMGITGIPEDCAGFRRLLERTRTERAAFDPANREVAGHVLTVIVNWFPAPLRPLVGRLVPLAIAAFLDPPLPGILGLRTPPRWFTHLVRASMRTRGRLFRHLPPRRDTRPYTPRPRSYPHGWTVHHLGPNRRASADSS